MKLEKLPSIELGENPLKYGEGMNMGVYLGTNVVVQYGCKEGEGRCCRLILVDLRTGERMKVTF